MHSTAGSLALRRAPICRTGRFDFANTSKIRNMRIADLTIAGRVWPFFAMLKKSVLRGCFACRADIACNARTEVALRRHPTPRTLGCLQNPQSAGLPVSGRG